MAVLDVMGQSDQANAEIFLLRIRPQLATASIEAASGSA
jgi:hypothetical protein